MLDTRDYEARLVDEMELESDDIFRMIDQGWTPGEISKTLKVELDIVMEKFLDLFG